MLCPECSHPLSAVILKTDTHDVTLDYCNYCGGVWSDQGEINFVKLKDLPQLHVVLPKTSIPPSQQFNLCPKDRTQLIVHRAESVPLDLIIFHCPICEGTWFPEGALEKFKQAQEVKINYFKTWKIPLPSIHAVLLPVLLLLLISGGLVATLYGLKQNGEVRTKAHEIISPPYVLPQPQQQVLISFNTQTAATTKVSYWLEPNQPTTIWISQVPQITHSVLLKDLIPNRTYYYQIFVVEPTPITSVMYSFEVKE